MAAGWWGHGRKGKAEAVGRGQRGKAVAASRRVGEGEVRTAAAYKYLNLNKTVFSFFFIIFFLPLKHRYIKTRWNLRMFNFLCEIKIYT